MTDPSHRQKAPRTPFTVRRAGVGQQLSTDPRTVLLRGVFRSKTGGPGIGRPIRPASSIHGPKAGAVTTGGVCSRPSRTAQPNNGYRTSSGGRGGRPLFHDPRPFTRTAQRCSECRLRYGGRVTVDPTERTDVTHAPLYSVLRDLVDQGFDDATVARHLMARPDAADIALALAEQAAARMRRTKMRDIEQSVHEAVTVAQARSPHPEPGVDPPVPPGLNGLDPAVLDPYVRLRDVDVYVSAARGRVRWGDMTVDDHLARAAVFDGIIAGNERSRLRHLRLADFLRRTGAPTLDDLLALAGIP